MSSPFAALDPCVHCGFCLPACPTYLATGDEADSPRGRIVLMRALERGEVRADDAALLQHLDACLGCRGCEPVCPSGVGYGRGLEAARTLLADQRGFRPLARLVLGVFARRAAWRTIFGAARWLRRSGLADRLASPRRFGMAMLAATRPIAQSPNRPIAQSSNRPIAQSPSSPTVALFRGCVMDELFGHVHDATRRTLEANGYTVVEAPGQGCCGALQEHAGDPGTARTLARANLAAFAGRADFIVVNSAGCGALLKDYGHLLGDDAGRRFAAQVRDVSELLAGRGPRPGGALDLAVAYDAPCHLQHAQRVHEQVLAVLREARDIAGHLPGNVSGSHVLDDPPANQLRLARRVVQVIKRGAGYGGHRVTSTTGSCSSKTPHWSWWATRSSLSRNRLGAMYLM